MAIKSSKSSHINCFGILSRDNRFVYQTTSENINSDFVIEQLDLLSLTVQKHTVIVLDNAKTHQSKK
ncbi:transposase [Arachidicoccus ginsenosidimutans]|uniref:transposase n=1 Tax=Arachidicoccus sp. BS20 TaxID=1850526 RepID=UPI0009EE2802